MPALKARHQVRGYGAEHGHSASHTSDVVNEWFHVHSRAIRCIEGWNWSIAPYLSSGIEDGHGAGQLCAVFPCGGTNAAVRAAVMGEPSTNTPESQRCFTIDEPQHVATSSRGSAVMVHLGHGGCPRPITLCIHRQQWRDCKLTRLGSRT